METIAVYWEEHIKVYGITPKYGLSLASLRFQRSKLAKVAIAVGDLEKQISRFELVTYQDINDTIQLNLLLEKAYLKYLMTDKFFEDSELVKNDTFYLNEPVDALYLHGPHFQDRFGILDTALSALGKHKIQVVNSGCAGTSMYLVLPAKIGPLGYNVLKETFLIPHNV